MKLDFLQNNVNKTMLTTSVACLYLRESLNVRNMKKKLRGKRRGG